jgi:hypothetical protein
MDSIAISPAKSPCVVCGRSTDQVVRRMGRVTDPIWCCHEHDDRTIVRVS